MAVPGATLTLTGVGRAPDCFRAVATSATDLCLINSGSCMLMPHASKSPVSVYLLSCLGNVGVGLGKGIIGVPSDSGELGQIAFNVGGGICAGMVSVQRTTGTTQVVTGGATQAPVAAPAEPAS